MIMCGQDGVVALGNENCCWHKILAAFGTGFMAHVFNVDGMCEELHPEALFTPGVTQSCDRSWSWILLKLINVVVTSAGHICC